MLQYHTLSTALYTLYAHSTTHSPYYTNSEVGNVSTQAKLAHCQQSCTSTIASSCVSHFPNGSLSTRTYGSTPCTATTLAVNAHISNNSKCNISTLSTAQRYYQHGLSPNAHAGTHALCYILSLLCMILLLHRTLEHSEILTRWLAHDQQSGVAVPQQVKHASRRSTVNRCT
eukprot:10992-Heterococcus_DN1.PRE.6